MSHGHTTYLSKGACIYCRDSREELSKEHIVPLALGGTHVILKASCKTCSAITSKFELDVTRGLWGDARISYNAPTRRKKQRPADIILPDLKAMSPSLVIPYNEYPAPMIFYKMQEAGHLQGLPEDIDLSPRWEMINIVDEKRLQDFIAKYPGRLTAKFKHVPQSFGRLIAKIGYGQILTHLNLEDFNPLCIPYILGEKQNISFIVGANPRREPPQIGVGYSLRTTGILEKNRMLLIAEVRLIANNDTPTYHVVVGEVLGKEEIKNALDKIGHIEVVRPISS